MIEISNIRVRGHSEKIAVICPECSYKNSYFVQPQSKFEAVRTCKGCGAILIFTCEEVKNA